MGDLPKIILAIESWRAYEQQLLMGISRYAHERGSWLFFHERDPIHKSLSDIEDISPDGIIVSTNSKAEILELIPDDVPCIVIGDSKINDNWLSITCDSEEIGKTAAKYLLSLGFNRFAFCGIDNAAWSIERKKGFTAAINDAGLTVKSYNCSEDTIFAAELSQMTKWIASFGVPTAIFACNDNRALKVSQACKAAEIKVPIDIAILGVNNDTSVYNLACTPLSSIALNTTKIGYEAASALDLLIKKQGENLCVKTVVTPVDIIVRQSTNILAVSDVVVATALDFIKKHARNQIQVSDVAEHISISRRELERRFKKHLNHSIHQGIKEAKVRLIANMLLDNSNTVSGIANEFGFSSAAHMARYFKDIHGLNPSEYRKKNTCLAY